MTREERNVEREARVWEFALDNDIEVEWLSKWNRNARAAWYRDDGRKIVLLPPIRGQISYLVALHELGHHLGHKRHGVVRLEEEALAWRWALANADEEPTLATWRSIERRLRNYLARALRWKSMRLPGEGSEFHSLLAEVAAITGTLS